MVAIKAAEFAFPRMEAPDLDAMEEFLTQFGMVRAERTPDSLYMRGADSHHHLHAVDDLDLVAVGLGQPHALAAARLVQGLDARCARQLGEPLEVVLAGRMVGEADELGAALVHGVQMMMAVGAAHVERIGRTLGAHHAEIG